jgi:T5SS/PEP-CTERM-associated repeat protein
VTIVFAAALAFASPLVKPSAGATSLDWITASGGLFNTPGNWSPAGPPVAGETAVFSLSNTFTVTFESNVTNTASVISNGTVTFALSGRTYSLTLDGLEVRGGAGQTGRLTLANGTVVGQLSVGGIAGGTGLLTIGDDATVDSLGMNAYVGQVGVGTMTVNNGGRYMGTGDLHVGGLATAANGTIVVTGNEASFSSGNLSIASGGTGAVTITSGATASTQELTIGSFGTGDGALTVTGAGSTLTTNGQELSVGTGGFGDMTISTGGTVAAGRTDIGDSSISTGNLTVTGGTSSLSSTSGTFSVGAAGIGSMQVTSGGTVNSLASQIAASAGSTGSATVSGGGSTWNASSLAIGGTLGVNGGAGTLTVEAGGTVNVTGATEIRSSAGSSLTIDGGTLVVGGTFTRLGTLKHNAGTLHVKGIYDNGSGPTALVIDGAASGDLATLRLSGNFAVQDVNSLTVGSTNQGALVLDGGRTFSFGNAVSIGAGGLSSGTISVSGNGTNFTTSSIVNVGGSGGAAGGAGTVNVGAGATFDAGLINLFSQGVINVNGGTLRVGNFVPQGGSVNFNAGEVAFTVGVIASESQLDALLGPSHVLGAGRRLGGTTSLAFNAPLTIDGGDLVATTTIANSSTLEVNAGSLTATTTLTNNAGRLLRVSGAGLVTAASGITNSGTIELVNNLVPTSGGTLTNNGTIRGSGFIGNNLTNNAAGQVQVTTGYRIEFQGAANSNSGSMSMIGGELVIVGSLNNLASTGLISGRDAILRATGGISNFGSLAFTAGQMDVYGDIVNNVGGRITVSGGGTATFYDDITIAVGANNVQATAVGGSVSSVVFFGSYNGGISGGGTAFIEGDHRPGNSPGLVNFGGDVAYGDLSRLFIELGGAARGTQYDAVEVAGATQLGGSLDVTLLGGYQPNSGDTFEILHAADGIAGTFSEEDLPALRGGLYFEIEYSAQSVTLETVGVLGDYNRNGHVDSADYIVWRNSLNQPGAGLFADGSGDGQITRLDFDVWKSQFGQPLGSGDQTQQVPTVPEPASALLCTIGLLFTIHTIRYKQ